MAVEDKANPAAIQTFQLPSHGALLNALVYVAAGRSPEAGREVLTGPQRDFEELSLMLRTPRGVPWEALARPDELDGLIDEHEGRAVLTVRGRLLANEVTTRIRSGSLH